MSRFLRRSARSICVLLPLLLILQVLPASVASAAPAASPTNSTIVVCGTVTAYTPAGTGSAGSISLDGDTFVIAPGVGIAGSTVAPGNAYCFHLTVRSDGPVVAATAASVPGAALSICGIVSSYSLPTGVGTGSITIGGLTLTIAAHATFTGSSITIGNYYCLAPVMNGANQIASAAVTSSSSTPLVLCGTVTQFAAATTTATGSITIGGLSLVIAKNTAFTGSAITIGGGYCITATVNGSNQLASGSVAPATTVSSSSFLICGTVTAFSPPGGSTGLITIAGDTLVFAAGASISGSAVTIGNAYCLAGTINSAGRVTSATISTVSTTPPPTGTPTAPFIVCGVVTGFMAPTAAANGSITVSGFTFPIPAGVAVYGTPVLGYSYCVQFNFSGTQIVSVTFGTGVVGVVAVCGVFESITTTTIVVSGIGFYMATTETFTSVLIADQVYCFLVSSGLVVGVLTVIPTSAAPLHPVRAIHQHPAPLHGRADRFNQVA